MNAPRCGDRWSGYVCDLPAGHDGMHRGTNALIRGPFYWQPRNDSRPYDADVEHLATYVLEAAPHRALEAALRAARIHGLACAVQRAVDEWLEAHPLPTEATP